MAVWEGVEFLPGGGVCPAGVSAWGFLPRRGVSAQEEGVCPRGGCLHRRGCTPLWTAFLTHACENITFPQLLLRTVKIEGLFNVEIVDCNRICAHPGVKVRSHCNDCCDIGQNTYRLGCQVDIFSRIELFLQSSCQVKRLITRMTFNSFLSCLMSKESMEITINTSKWHERAKQWNGNSHISLIS